MKSRQLLILLMILIGLLVSESSIAHGGGGGHGGGFGGGHGGGGYGGGFGGGHGWGGYGGGFGGGHGWGGYRGGFGGGYGGGGGHWGGYRGGYVGGYRNYGYSVGVSVGFPSLLALLCLPLLFFTDRYNARYPTRLYRTKDGRKSPTTRIEPVGLLFKSRRLLSPCERMSGRMATSRTSAQWTGAGLLVLLY